LSVVKLQKAIEIAGEPGIVIESVTVTPACAAEWLKANKHNRPVRRRHVEFLASEIENGNWQMNGQPLVISEAEEILDGQHRSLAVIEAGIPIKTLVVYGISPKAFSTIDTGAPRTNVDALSLNFGDMPTNVVKAVGAAVPWCYRMEKHFIGKIARISNTESLAYVKKHHSLWHCAETLVGYPLDARPISLAMGTACYEMFQRKHQERAEAFMHRFFTGEQLQASNPEYILRGLLARDATRIAQTPANKRMRMIVKAWNLRRRGIDSTTRQAIVLNPQEADKLVVL
jgi:hypothetical protein